MHYACVIVTVCVAIDAVVLLLRCAFSVSLLVYVGVFAVVIAVMLFCVVVLLLCMLFAPCVFFCPVCCCHLCSCVVHFVHFASLLLLL